MNILFVHQSFPGQYRHIISALASQQCHNIIGLGIHELTESLPSGVSYFRYPLSRGNTPGIHPWLIDFDSKLVRAEGCGNACHSLKMKGFIPDVICCHSGWGEALFLSDIWPSTPIISYQEFFYKIEDSDSDFDPEFPSLYSWHDRAKLRLKNANPLLMLDISATNVTPTFFQRDTFPSCYHQDIHVIHDGIDTSLACPPVTKDYIAVRPNIFLSREDTVVTFVNRSIEPYRGCHTFIRSIPHILSSNPKAHIVIVGSSDGVSYGRSNQNESWKDKFLSEIEGSYNKDQVHFVGSLSYAHYLSLLKISSCHVYLTYPFVLSWSLLEAMSIGIPVVGSNTAPVSEIITDGDNGLLVDFFSPIELSHRITTVLHDELLSNHLSHNARKFVLQNYSLDTCVPHQLQLISNTIRS